ncbi:MAG: MlaD family protein, partial [Rudaea sp.]
MKRDNINYVLVGTVVAAALVLLIVVLAVITGRGGASSSYVVHYRNVTGLRYGAPVFYQGYRIGQVSEIDPERHLPAKPAVDKSSDKAALDASGTRYKVTLAVRRDWPIP